MQNKYKVFIHSLHSPTASKSIPHSYKGLSISKGFKSCNSLKGSQCSVWAWFTSAGRGGAIPLRGVSRDTVDGGIALQLIARVAGEAQRLACLVKGLFRALHAGRGSAGVPAGLVLFS